MRQRSTLYIDKGNNPTRGYNPSKYLCTHIRTLKYVKQMLVGIKGEINRNLLIVRDFNTPLTSMDRSSRQKINKETATLNTTLNQMDLMISSGHFTPKQKNIHPFQGHMEHFLG